MYSALTVISSNALDVLVEREVTRSPDAARVDRPYILYPKASVGLPVADKVDSAGYISASDSISSSNFSGKLRKTHDWHNSLGACIMTLQSHPKSMIFVSSERADTTFC